MVATKHVKAAIPRAGARKVNVYDIQGEAKSQMELPEIFNEEFRPDIIRKAVTAARANRRQAYGPKPGAGMRHAVSWPGKGRGMARTPRTHHGSGKGAQSPNTPGGRRAHPPTVETIWAKSINHKERRLARRSALAACADVETVRARGHIFKDGITLPVVAENDFEDLPKIVDDMYLKSNEVPQYVKETAKVLELLGVSSDVDRAQEGKHIRSGRGKMRGRRYRTPKSLLVVVSNRTTIERCFRNLPGVEIATPRELNLEMLAPGGDPGRLMVISKKALESLKGVA
ncbi:MAG: 50S ribosomal protein L4 [Methanobacteriota archaeon]